MQGTLASQKRQVGIKISDGNDILYDEDSDKDPNPLFSKKVTLDFYGRAWEFDIRSDLSFRESSANNQPLFVLFGGMFIDSLLLGLFLLLSQANRRALKYADQMTTEFRMQTENLEKSNAELNDFAYVASHDLKSPLRGIDQLATWIAEDIDNKEETLSHLTMMRSRVNRMENLLNDLLDYSKVGKIEDKIQSVDCKNTLESIYDLLSPPETFTLEINGGLPVFDTVDTAFHLVFRNLISNSIKHHNGDDGTITITVEEQEHFYIFRVQDDGPGIEQKFHEKIFGLYQTLRPKDEVEGSGMGLAIIKKTLEYYGGSITLSPEQTQGACFFVSWPKKISVKT